MVKRKTGLGSGARWRTLTIAAVASLATLWSSAAMATITQGDFSVFGFFETREEARWGEGGAKPNGIPAVPGVSNGRAATESGGSFDFNHWDLDEARQLGDIRPDYHMVKNYKFFGRFDTLILKDADFFAFYRPWYDAEGSIKSYGVAKPMRDAPEYNQSNLQSQYFRDDLHEYYAQLNFTDNFSMRVGKQQIIWSEADALSGTEITNPVDATYHWITFETPEYERKNLEMVKFNYILPDFLKTANNEMEAVWIPGDWEGDGLNTNVSDPRSPWMLPLHTAPGTGYNFQGQPFRNTAFPESGYTPGGSPLAAIGPGLYAEEFVPTVTRKPSKSVGDMSEFAFRYSSLLPIGSGLQTSFIYLFEARADRIGFCTSCPRLGPGYAALSPGLYLGLYPPLGIARRLYPAQKSREPATVLGGLYVPLSYDYLRRNWFGLTGTYYDKELTDMVFRYDALYEPKVGVAISNNRHTATGAPAAVGAGPGVAAAWTQQSRFILAADRPTYIPWISKQHTFLVFQYTNTFWPSRPNNAVPFFGNFGGKLRQDQSFFFASAVNWVMNGQLTTTNTYEWDMDDNLFALSSTNVYRYSRNILLGLNAQWYLGRSGRYTDPFALSYAQRLNELEATLSYEI